MIAKDHDANNGSNGGSVCHFNSTWSDCEGTSGNHYKLKQASIDWFQKIAAGGDPGDNKGDASNGAEVQAQNTNTPRARPKPVQKRPVSVGGKTGVDSKPQ
jgi:hypothetical protein